jgi:hypothetical protein
MATTTGVLAGAAGTFGVLALTTNNKLDSEFQKFPTDEDKVEKLRGNIKVYSILADGIGAGAIVAGGVALYFLINPKMVPVDDAQEAGFRSLEVVGHPGGLGMRGRF